MISSSRATGFGTPFFRRPPDCPAAAACSRLCFFTALPTSYSNLLCHSYDIALCLLTFLFTSC